MSWSRQIFKRGVGILLIVILLNLYWILPNIYSIIVESGVVINSKINLLFSPEATIRSQSFNDLNNIVIGKNFLFDWRAFNYETNQYSDLMQVWSSHLATGYALISLYVFTLLSVLGAIFSFFKKDKVGISVFAIALYSLFFLSGGNFGSKVFEEALRMPFTKFSILLIFALSYFFGYFILRVISLYKSRFARVFVGVSLFLAISLLLVNSVLPMFNGGLISPIVRRELPHEYIELFDGFKGKDGRVATLPLNTLWGWNYHSWKYEGSGFLTYGLSNPILMRDFDRWSAYNETFFDQASFALYGNNPEVFSDTLKKYKIKYLVLDESIINAGGGNKLLYIDQIKKLLVSNVGIKKDQQFGFLSVYETNFNSSEVIAINRYTINNTDLTYSEVDPIYPDVGDYIQSDGVTPAFSISSESAAIKGDLTFGGFKSGYNCDLMKLGSVSKKVGVNGITYESSDNGIECDFFEFPTLLHSQGYRLRIKGKNLAGRSLKIYLQNWVTNRIDLEELLPIGEFDESFVILPKGEVTGNEVGYSLNLETRSFGKIASENIVTSIEFYPVDTNYLDSLGGQSSQVVNNNLKIQNVEKQGNWLYKVETTGSGLLELGQGFDRGWVAFQLTGSILETLKHVKVNSWSNGWLVEGTRQQALVNSSEGSPNAYSLVPSASVFIFFWPQLLEWGGALLGIISFIILASKRRKNVS